MTTPRTISDLISRWPSVAAFAADIGCGYEAARKMRDRESIAAAHWVRVVDAASRRGVEGISFEWLADQRARSSAGAAA